MPITVAQAEQNAREKLGSALEARILISYHLQLPLEEWILQKSKILPRPNVFFNLVARRQSLEPIAYITGEKEFYGNKFRVNKSVLIPRPDSEILVEQVIKYCRDYNRKLRGLELGVGSGCLSISLALEIENLSMFGVDISKDALKICIDNVAMHRLEKRIILRKSDWYEDLEADLANSCDFIISNPPYVTSCDSHLLSDETKKFEPGKALFTDDNLESYEQIAAGGHRFLKKDGVIFIEIGKGQGDRIERIFIKNRWQRLTATSDLNGIVRVISYKISN